MGEYTASFDSLCFYLFLTPTHQVRAPTDHTYLRALRNKVLWGIKQSCSLFPRAPSLCAVDAALLALPVLATQIPQNMMCLTLHACPGSFV